MQGLVVVLVGLVAFREASLGDRGTQAGDRVDIRLAAGNIVVVEHG